MQDAQSAFEMKGSSSQVDISFLVTQSLGLQMRDGDGAATKKRQHLVRLHAIFSISRPDAPPRMIVRYRHLLATTLASIP